MMCTATNSLTKYLNFKYCQADFLWDEKEGKKKEKEGGRKEEKKEKKKERKGKKEKRKNNYTYRNIILKLKNLWKRSIIELMQKLGCLGKCYNFYVKNLEEQLIKRKILNQKISQKSEKI